MAGCGALFLKKLPPANQVYQRAYITPTAWMSLRRRAVASQAFLDRPATIGFSFFPFNGTLRGRPTKLALVNSGGGAGGLFSSTAHRLILIAVSKSWFRNSIRFLPLGTLTSATSPRNFALRSICSSVSALCFCISPGLCWYCSISTL